LLIAELFLKHCIEAFNVVCTFDSLEATLTILQVAPISAVIENVDHRLDLETFELQTLAILLEYFDLWYNVGYLHFI
jgi:hypothetical protein